VDVEEPVEKRLVVFGADIDELVGVRPLSADSFEQCLLIVFQYLDPASRVIVRGPDFAVTTVHRIEVTKTESLDAAVRVLHVVGVRFPTFHHALGGLHSFSF